MSKTRIVVFGDSVAAGTLAKLDVFQDCFQYETTTVNRVRDTQTWWSILGRILSDWVDGGVEVINVGVAGDTVAQGLARLDQDVTAHSPDYVLVMFGPEDVLQGVEARGFQNDLEKIVNRIAAPNTIPVLITPVPFSERMTAGGITLDEVRPRQGQLAQCAQVVRSLAEKNFLPLIDLHRYFLDNRLAYDHLFEGWLPDGVAQSAMASFVAGELLPILRVKEFLKLTLADYRQVYSDPEHLRTRHNAFTDLTYYQGEFFVVFRSAQGHGDLDGGDFGIEVVLRSEDGVTWVKEVILQVKGFDNRDPKLLQVNGRLMLYAPCVRCVQGQPGRYEVITYGFERLGQGQWSKPFECGHCFFWRPKKWRDQFVAAPYAWPDNDAAVKLLGSPDGCGWREVSVICGYESYNNETDLWVEDNQLVAFSRHDPPEGDHYLQVSTFLESENRWETVSSGRIIQAPCVFKAKGRLFVVGRTCAYPHEDFSKLGEQFSKVGRGEPDANVALAEKYHHGLRTGIFVMDGTRARQVAELLSAGDSSYPGVVQYGDEYVISDYSMHEYYRPVESNKSWETPADIYVSRIRIGKE